MAVDLALAKLHLRVDHSDEDTLIAQYLAAAIAWVENFTGKLLTRRQVTQDEACFGSHLTLFHGPSPDTISIEYVDTDDAPQTIADALLVKDRLYPSDSWPSIATNSEIQVTYTAGYETTPADLDNAVLLLVGDYYANREPAEASQPSKTAAASLCNPYRSVRV